MKFAQRSGGGKNYLKLKAGESVRGVFRGDPVDYRMHWVGGRGVDCPPKDCPHCATGDKSGFRFRVNFVLNENGAYTAKVFENGWGVYEAMRALHEGDYNLEHHLVKLTRHGSGKETSYSIIPVPNGTLAASQEALVSAVALHPLTTTEESDSKEDTAPPHGDEDAPF